MTDISLLSIILALTPVIIIFILLTIRRTPADIAGLIGWLVTVIIAGFYFKTALNVILLSSLGGIVASLPIAMVVATSIFQVTIMQETGAIARIVALIKTISPSDTIVQIMLINVGFGTLLTALGAVPVSILPPIMLSLGYTSFVAIALPAIGYDALTTYALLGVPVVVFSNIVGMPVKDVGMYFARFMPVISTCIALGMLWLVGGCKMVIRGSVPAAVSGLTAGFICIGLNELGLITITGIAAGIGVILVMLLYLFLLRKPILDRNKMDAVDKSAEKRMTLLAALSPWIILTVLSLLVNAPFLPAFELTFNRFSMPLEIIPGSPEKIRLLWQAYFWIVISTLVSLPIMKASSGQIKIGLQKWLKRAPRPVFSAAIFFAIAYLINHSGKNAGWQMIDVNLNMIALLAKASSSAFGQFYPLVAPFLGLFGGFISGSETSAIAMLTKLHLSTAEEIGAIGLLIAAASGIGGGLASVISPAKLQNAAASIDRIGDESKVIRKTVIIAMIITAVCALMTMIWAY
ncbi:MAG: lactate permease [Chloroflexi bacterium RBG_16_47_49]|nr:MAG: lactate permease [Chloroflexi bacterium RBG_16_47_49]